MQSVVHPTSSFDANIVIRSLLLLYKSIIIYIYIRVYYYIYYSKSNFTVFLVSTFSCSHVYLYTYISNLFVLILKLTNIWGMTINLSNEAIRLRSKRHNTDWIGVIFHWPWSYNIISIFYVFGLNTYRMNVFLLRIEKILSSKIEQRANLKFRKIEKFCYQIFSHVTEIYGEDYHEFECLNGITDFVKIEKMTDLDTEVHQKLRRMWTKPIKLFEQIADWVSEWVAKMVNIDRESVRKFFITNWTWQKCTLKLFQKFSLEQDKNYKRICSYILMKWRGGGGN